MLFTLNFDLSICSPQSLSQLPWESISSLITQTVTRIPSLCTLQALLSLHQRRADSPYNTGVDRSHVVAVVDPDTNLEKTANTLVPQFSKWVLLFTLFISFCSPCCAVTLFVTFYSWYAIYHLLVEHYVFYIFEVSLHHLQIEYMNYTFVWAHGKNNHKDPTTKF